MTDVRLTPTQRKIMDVLADGRSHLVEDLLGCLPDDMTTVKTLRVHVHNIRTAVNAQGLDVIAHRTYGKSYYRLVRNVSADE